MSKQVNFGGQAVMEGVMMRGSRAMAVAVRAPDNTIVIHEETITSPLYNGVWSRLPFIRGLGLLWDSLGLGTRALMFSARVAVGEEASFSGPVSWGTLGLSLAFFVLVFFIGPRALTDGIVYLAGIGLGANNPWVSLPLVGNLLEGIVRLVMVIGYIWLIGRIPDIQRVFMYHGAEHKTINAFEAGAELTPEIVSAYPLEHPRCGTGFLLVVVIISVLVFSLLGSPPLVVRFLSRIVLVPVIAMIAYEYIRFTAQHLESRFIRILIKPQLLLQRLTTREPSSAMLEVGIAALEKVLKKEALSASALNVSTVELSQVS